VADDSEVEREQVLRTFFQLHGDSAVVKTCATRMAVEQIQLSRPDIVVLDIPVPHRDGVQVLREIRRETPSAVIIMFTADPSVVLQEVCLEAGANYYLHKTQLRELIDICSDRLVRTGTASNW
jgi:DNA-binding response OmpR family regulator